jgi:ParB-like chromosome segregation protein Spo0J
VTALGEIHAADASVKQNWGLDCRERLPLDKLRLGRSVRADGLDEGHLELIQQLEGDWSPILVLRPEMLIVDGHYRYLAAKRLGYKELECEFFDGSSDDAFIEAIQRNCEHGLPLSLKERRAAAAQVLAIHEDWSDRRIGKLCGLSHTTVTKVRSERVRPEGFARRKGLDERFRPSSRDKAREAAIAALRENPVASLRQIARMTGSSPETVRTIKKRMFASQEPPTACVRSQTLSAVASPMTGDLAFASTETGLAFAAWFERGEDVVEWRNHIEAIPLSRLYEVVDQARKRSVEWARFADELARRVRS